MKRSNSTMATPDTMIRTAKLFEFYVRRVWPYHRIFVKHKLSRRCKNCAASNKMIPLNSQGICEKCDGFNFSKDARDKKSEIELHRILSEAQGKGAQGYDALVLFSGGKDSTYMIRYLQETYPQLRLFAYTIDNGFMSPIARQNIAEILPRLRVDHIFVTPTRDFYETLFHYAICHLNSSGGYGTVDFSDGEFMLDTARNIAYEKEIPLILCGYSRYQVQNGMGLWHYETPRSLEVTTRVHTAGLALQDIFPKEEDRNRWWQGGVKDPHRIARVLFPLYAWDLEESYIKDKVKEWGLMSSKTHSPIVTNHLLIPLLGVVDVHQFGYSSFEIEFCRMIREGRADQRDWLYVFEFLEYAAKTGMFVKTNVSQSLDWLGLTLKDVRIDYV